MMHLLKTVTVVAAVSTLFWVAGCNSAADTESQAQQIAPAPTAKPLRVAMIPKSTGPAFWKSVQRGAQDAAQEFNVNLDWNGPQAEPNVARQVALVEAAIKQGVDGIVLAPIDRKALSPAIDKAAKAKIPVVLFDSDADTKNRVSLVAADNYSGGKLAARYIGKLMRGKGTALVLAGSPKAQPAGDREKGFTETLRKAFPQIKIVRSTSVGADQGRSAAAVEQALTAQPEATVVFASSAGALTGALGDLRSRRLNGKVHLIGFGNASTVVAGLRSGEIKALIVQNSFKLGYEGVKALAEFRAGRQVEPRLDAGFKLIIQAEMDTPENRQLLSVK